MTISVVDRPYLLTFHASGHTYPLTSVEAQRLLDEYPAVRATRNRVVLPGHNTSRVAERCTIRPATLGGGPAFLINGVDPTRARLYGIFFTNEAGRACWAMERNRTRAIRSARNVRGFVTSMVDPIGGGPWDAPTFRVCSDRVDANFTGSTVEVL